MYNPFRYLRSEVDCVQLVTLLFRATTPKGSHSSDPFWERAEETLVTALVLFIYLECDPEDQNFATVMFLLRNAQASEEDEGKQNPVDTLFAEIAQEHPEHIANQYWEAYKLAAGKTAKSILIMASSRLKHFMLDEIADMTMEDEMDLASLGEKKRAIFVCTPVNDTSFNYLVSMMYMQAFQQLYDRAEREYGGRLPRHVRFIMDEFYNTPPPQKKKFTFDRNAKGVRELLSMKFDVMDFKGPWYDAFGTPERRGVWIIWGNSGSGKTSFALQLCKYLCRFGRVAYDSMEEGACRTMQDAIRRTGMMDVNKKFLLIDNENMEELSIRLRRQKSPDIVVIDSFQYTRMNYRQYIDFKEQHKRKLLIFISHAEGQLPNGRAAKGVMYDASLKIYVEGFRAFSKGRFIGPVGYYDIVPEKARQYHGEE